MKYIVSVIILFLFGINASYSQQPFSDVNEKTQLLIQKFLQKENIPGASVTITYNDTVIFSEGFGYADVEAKILVDPALTKFRIASITKTITAATLARLAENGKIDLAKSAYHYLDSLPKKQYDFTIEQLGGHIAGLARNASEDDYACTAPYQRKDFYRVFNKDALAYKPGEQILYSNYGYKMLGLIIEKVTQMPLTDVHKKFVVDKLGLRNTLPDTKIYDSNTTKFYTLKDEKIIESQCLDCSFMYAEGCYLSTSQDLARLGNAFLYVDRLLKKESLLSLVKSKKLVSGQKTGYGFGFVTNKDTYSHAYYGHNGTLPGARSALRIYPDSKLVVVILLNRYVEDIDTLTTNIAHNYIKCITK